MDDALQEYEGDRVSAHAQLTSTTIAGCRIVVKANGANARFFLASYNAGRSTHPRRALLSRCKVTTTRMN